MLESFGLSRFGVDTFGLGVVAVVRDRHGTTYTRRLILPIRDSDEIPIEQLLREDEELIALVITAIHEGIIP